MSSEQYLSKKIISSLLTKWVNIYHIPVKDANKDDFGYN